MAQSSIGEELIGIGELAARSGVAATALRYYEQVGLLVPVARVGGRRRYGPDAVLRLRVVGLCKAAGFSLEEILGLFRDRAPGRAASRALAMAKLDAIEAQMAQLAIARRILELGMQCRCRSLDECSCAVHDQLAALAGAAPC
jgi:DNA-binding transcriptional MerR regulator